MQGVVVIGAGFTGKRVAARLLARGVRVVAATRDAVALRELASLGADVVAFEATSRRSWAALGAAAATLGPDLRLLIALPPVALDGKRIDAVGTVRTALPPPRRVVYLSTTSVYGERGLVDATTPVSTVDGTQAPRLAEERAVETGPWSWMILRAAAIYGPERGLHVPADPRRRHPRDPDAVTSRIHVDDLATASEAALATSVVGAFPVADAAPASAREVVAYCRAIGLGARELPPPRVARSSGRRVDGSAVLEVLDIALRFPTYREGMRSAAGIP